jgi:plastocyanin
VIWTNDDGVQHTVTSVPQGAFDSGPIDPGKTYSYTFNQAGTFEYSCTIHPSITHGNVVVK